MRMTVKFNLNEDQVNELELLRKAMIKAAGNKPEDEEYYTLDKVFDFVMQLSSVHRINSAIENAAYCYDDYYENYPYKYGKARTNKILAEDSYASTAYPNPTIVRD